MKIETRPIPMDCIMVVEGQRSITIRSFPTCFAVTLTDQDLSEVRTLSFRDLFMALSCTPSTLPMMEVPV